MEHKEHHHHHHKEKKKHMAGKLITLLQLAASAALIIVLWNSGMLPVKYMIPVSIVLLALFGVTFGLQFVQKKGVWIIGVIISVLISVLTAAGAFYLAKANQAMKDVGGAAYKTDNMVVVVKKEDAAKNILDARNYRFGYQTSID